MKLELSTMIETIISSETLLTPNKYITCCTFFYSKKLFREGTMKLNYLLD